MTCLWYKLNSRHQTHPQNSNFSAVNISFIQSFISLVIM